MGYNTTRLRCIQRSHTRDANLGINSRFNRQGYQLVLDHNTTQLWYSQRSHFRDANLGHNSNCRDWATNNPALGHMTTRIRCSQHAHIRRSHFRQSLQSSRAHLHVVEMLWLRILTLSLLTPFYSVLVCIFVLMALSTVFHSINSPDNSPLSYSVLPVLFLSYWSFQLYISS